MSHSPTPWRLVDDAGDEVILASDGTRVHRDTAYYPSGLASEDAAFIVECVNRVAELERELADLKEGRTAIIPCSRDHAEKLLFMAETFWNGNANVEGWKNRVT